jgi:GNAT superfamily N-acetyltransferase
MFRRSLFDYLARTGLIEREAAEDPPVDPAWARQGTWMEHLAASAAEDWVALDADDRVLGWALSVERDGMLELAMFFVDPSIQGRGVGRELIERAFPIGRGRHRVIVATQDTRALGRYLRSGVTHQTTSIDLVGAPTSVEQTSDLSFEPLAADAASIEVVAAIEREVLGHRRDIDTRFLLGTRPAWVARRDGRDVGFAFGAQPSADGADPSGDVACGPIAALDPPDVPALIDHVIGVAAVSAVDQLTVTVPLANRLAVEHLLARGFRIDPFYVMVLADAPVMKLDRWVHTGPPFIV